MKKLIYMAGAALVMLASASCEKKETVKEAQSSAEKGEMVFTAAAKSGALKTTIASDGVTAVWSATDKLKVFTETDTQGSECSLTKGEGTSTAEFAGQCDNKGPWTAICPADKATGFNNGTITFTMPDTQTYDYNNTFAAGAMPCVAYSDNTTFEFDHSFGVLKLRLKLHIPSGFTPTVSFVGIKSIEVTTKGSEKLNGTFTVNPSSGSAAAVKSGTDGTNSITLQGGTIWETDGAADFWFVVPQGAFAKGFDVTVATTNNIVAKLSTTKDNTITAGKVREMPVQELVFEGLSGSADVSPSAGIPGNKVKWVQLKKDGPKWAEFNVGAKSVGDYGDHFYFLECGSVGTDFQGTEYDRAMNKWGGNWRTPTMKELGNNVADPLSRICGGSGYMIWTNNYNGTGKAGRVLRGYQEWGGNAVFLPAAGYYAEGAGAWENVGTDGYYSSSTIDESGYAVAPLHFNSQMSRNAHKSGESYHHCDEEGVGGWVFVRAIWKD